VPTIDLAVAARRLAWLLVAVAVAWLSFSAGAAVASAQDSARAAGVRAVHKAGISVRELQQALGITADGVYGPQTRRAVRRFQRAHGLHVDGIAGAQTLAALGITAQPASSSEGAAAALERIAECESGGDPTAVSDDRRYFGKYQFSRATWRSVGGEGNPAKASEAEQDMRAMRLYKRRGTAPWPVCGKQA
jgi:peptidoglycan hydrolase-like protein with peptidoglycan-binding domain